MIDVVLVDDQRLMLAGTRCLLERAGGLRVVAAVADLDGAAEVLDADRPDVVLLDLSLPGCERVDAVRRLVEGRQGLVVVALADEADADLAAEALAAGAAALLVKDAEPEDLLDAVRAACLRPAA